MRLSCAAIAILTTGLLASAGAPAEKPIRTVSEVDAAGRAAVACYADPKLAATGFLDVTKSPYNADPTGNRDATAAIQQAIGDARDARLVTFLPAGRYLVSETIEGIVGTVEWDDWPYEGQSDPWVAYASFEYPCVLMGSPSGGRATLVLADHAPGFDDPEHPKPVVYFWARTEWPALDPDKSESNINFNQKIVSLDVDLGRGNSGAVGIDHRGAEGSTIEDVAVKATGAYAGFRNAPGSGGAMHGIRVEGGRYGLYLPGSQPSPLVSDLTLSGQTEASIFYSGRGPLTIVGATIDGAPIGGRMPQSYSDGAISLVDSVVSVDPEKPAVETPRSLVLENVWFRGAGVVAKAADNPPLSGNRQGWTHVVRYIAAGEVRYPPVVGGGEHRDTIWIDRKPQSDPVVRVEPGGDGPPSDLLTRHRFPGQPDWRGPQVADVRRAPWNAHGDGVHDDTEAIQAAIDAGGVVFLPKGVYRVSRPLELRDGTRLFGVTNLLSVITPLGGAAAFNDVNHPRPLIETVDDPAAQTALEMLKLELPDVNPCVYALHWQAGRNSLVRNIYPIRTTWHPASPAIGIPRIRIDGSGSGRWYTQTLLGWWSQGPDYRHLLVEGTREPLRFYHLQPQHARSNALVEFRDARNIDVYSMKAEGMYTMLRMEDCHGVRLFGYGGNATPRPGWPIFELVDCDDLLIAGAYPQYMPAFNQVGKPTYGALAVGYDPRTWYLLRDGAVKIPGNRQFACYLLSPTPNKSQ